MLIDPAAPMPAGKRLVILVAYGLMLGGAILLFLLIRAQGEHLSHPTGAVLVPATEVKAPPTNPLLQVLLAMTVIVGTARAMGAVLRAVGQPPVIGEIIGGILLGPSFFGRIAPDLFGLVFPPTVSPFVYVIAQLGVILYMFLVGLELDLRVAQRRGHVLLAISHASIVVPFLLGAMLALGLYPQVATPGRSFTSFALFLGVSLSVTAFPVLARILTDQGVSKTPMGILALTCAAVDDVTAWCLLALAVGTAQAKTESAVTTIVLTLVYIALMLLIARPVLGRLTIVLEQRGRFTEGGMAIMTMGVLLSALATEVIGVHAIFGAFLIGVVIPHTSRLAGDLTDRVQDIVRVLFLPAFFAYTGLRTELGLLNSWEDWLLCGLTILVATLGKLGGSMVAARVSGLSWWTAAALGILMNTRGLVELIVLNIGLDLQIISPTLFTMLVIMALVTTVATTPIFRALTRQHPWRAASTG